jgi:hypothetical protein
VRPRGLLRFREALASRCCGTGYRSGASFVSRRISAGIFYFYALERFRAKWIPVRVKKTRLNNDLESFTVSIER